MIIRSMWVLLFSLMITNAFGQQGQGMRNMNPEESAKRQVDQMKEIIKIDAKEEAKVNEIFLKYAKEQQTLFSGMQQGGDREQMRAKMTELTTKRNAELEKVLDKERMDTYKKKLEELRQNRGRQRGF